ncbi:hypothetical protein AURDEDRAFT_177781 [Auricularia subglabra TFB-10046 SS5]|uniref:Uncharacterized protein n=1 Tax=Auricularia subglabra (strain TFB-10046 / SS5) TaxID=717982 RepID=J0L9S8_AURST|nr:hypothetical protein AURDEDRAFT_177781 [Auricularia subglabra TFB-10046 SS5]
MAVAHWRLRVEAPPPFDDEAFGYFRPSGENPNFDRVVRTVREFTRTVAWLVNNSNLENDFGDVERKRP